LGSTTTIRLREHNYASLSKDINVPGLISYLDEIWLNRLIFGLESTILEDIGEYSTNQPFFSFTHDHKIKANNYVGFTHWEDTRLEVLPKVFENKTSKDLWPHLIYWLSYCRRVNFPFSRFNTDLDKAEDFPEALIYTFAIHTRTLLQTIPYSRYEEVTEESQVMRGRLDFNKYLNEQFTKGNPHKLVVEHDPLLYNNLLNQIIKSVSSRLQGVCRFEETFHILQDIVLMMEDVEDVNVTISDCDRVHLNRLFTEYDHVLDMCRFFLGEGQLSHDTGSFQNFSFLLPMELIFEDYLAGFLEENFHDRYRTSYQSIGWLTDQNIFQMRYDILLKNKLTGKNIIVDAKYKLRSSEEKGKRGISQNDLYQMVSYAIRKNCDCVVLLYPENHASKNQIDMFSISSEMFNNGPIKIYAANVPFVHEDLKQADASLSSVLTKIFSEIDI
jgi:5-methylcytosine-specific restriction enzyme subunit McrC